MVACRRRPLRRTCAPRVTPAAKLHPTVVSAGCELPATEPQMRASHGAVCRSPGCACMRRGARSAAAHMFCAHGACAFAPRMRRLSVRCTVTATCATKNSLFNSRTCADAGQQAHRFLVSLSYRCALLGLMSWCIGDTPCAGSQLRRSTARLFSKAPFM